MTKRLLNACMIACLLFSAGPVWANLYCTGTISKLYVNKDGRVLAAGTWRDDTQYMMICDLDTTWNGLTAGDCTTWFSMLQGAYFAEATITLYYPLAGTTCTALATAFDSPAPHIVILGD